MPTGLSIKDSKPSKVRRLKFLPRLSFSMDFMNKRVEFTQAPLSELLYNLYRDGFSKENFMNVVVTQMKETRLGELSEKSRDNENPTR